MNPLVSIVIPAHNGELYIAEALDSILAQTYIEYEVWVVDNGSTDRTKQVVQSYPSVKYLYSEIADVALARNQGIHLSTGEYIAFLDQDDTWIPTKLTKQVEFLQSHPQHGAVIGLQHIYLQPGHLKPHWLKQLFLEKAQLAYLPSALMVRRSTFSITDTFNTAFSMTSDVAWFMKAQQKGVLIGILDEVLVHRRIHDHNMSSKPLQKELLATLKNALQEKRRANEKN